MATPAAGDFVISQGDTQPIMRIVIPANSQGELLDPAGCTLTFLGRPEGDRTNPPLIRRAVESTASEVEPVMVVRGVELTDVPVLAVYVHFQSADTKAVANPTRSYYVRMQGELEIVDADGEVLTIPNEPIDETDPEAVPYITWWVRDDIGDGA